MLSFEAFTHGLPIIQPANEDSLRHRRVTQTSRELHGFFTARVANYRKLNLVMQGAYVVRLGAHEKQSREELVGRIEEVDTGKSLRFHSGEELIAFLRGQQKVGLTEPKRKDR